MEISDAQLIQVCRQAGIQSAYIDIWGQSQAISRDTRVCLLENMGASLNSSETLTDFSEFLTTCYYPTGLRSVYVCEQKNRLFIPICFEEGTTTQRHRLSFLGENQDTWHITFYPKDLLPVENPTSLNGNKQSYKLELPYPVPLGYHQLILEFADKTEQASFIVCPSSCFVPKALEEQKQWGLSLQLYALRSDSNWGIGDFGDALFILKWLKQQRGHLLGVNPLHALFPVKPNHCSPYSPSSRLFLNYLYLDIPALPDFRECTEIQNRLQDPSLQKDIHRWRDADQVEYSQIALLKFSLLEMLYKNFQKQHLKKHSSRAEQFWQFCNEQSEPLETHACFESLCEHFRHTRTGTGGWPSWPHTYHDLRSSHVRTYQKAQRQCIDFYKYLQWLSTEQLARVSQQAQEDHIYLYQDLAVGCDRSGSEFWSNPNLFASQAGIGAPPDEFNLQGQNWGLPPMLPHQLFQNAYRSFIHLLRQNMRYTHVLRIDHVMGLSHLFWIPQGGSARDGAYVSYPFHDLLNILALESHRQQCAVVGEDLGTVVPEIRETLKPKRVFSYRLLYFEKDHQNQFIAPEDYPADALATITTHDLPSLRGWWNKIDILEKEQCGLFSNDEQKLKQHHMRQADRFQLLVALKQHGLLPVDLHENSANQIELSEDAIVAIVDFVARSRSRLMTIQLEDLFKQLYQVNLPGTTSERPNWQMKSCASLTHLERSDFVQRVLQAIHRYR